MKKTFFFLFLHLGIQLAFAQTPFQTVRGTISDSDSKFPLPGALVTLLPDNISVKTDSVGKFIFENVRVGRISIQVNHSGYEQATFPDIEVNSGKEQVLNLYVQERVLELKEFVLKYPKKKGTSVNDMSLVSTRSISLEESKRYAGGFNDPSKVLSNFAGVTNSSNGQNDIIVRGNSPKYVQWRLEGVEISNPTHFADQNSIKGGISALNNNLLATSDFSTGAFAPEYGNVLSGVYDVKLRSGNNKKFESSAGIGILGTEATLEGPFKKNYDGSFLVNYRYSTISLVSKMGLLNADGVLSYQDAAFKVDLPSKKSGNFSIFGLGGLSGFSAQNVQPDVSTTPTNTTNEADIQDDYKKQTYLSTIGINHTYTFSNSRFLKTTLAYCNNGISEDIYQIKTTRIFSPQGQYLYDSLGEKNKSYQSRLLNSTYLLSLMYTKKINARHTVLKGFRYYVYGYQNTLRIAQKNSPELFEAMNLNRHMGMSRSFISWKWRIHSTITMVSGLHSMSVSFNKKYTFEPRVALSWKITPSNIVSLGYGMHSAMEKIHNYFARVQQSDGTVTEPNHTLGLLKAHHVVAGYEKRFTDNIRLKSEVYYQYLYNLPVENNDTSYYATINEGTDFRYVPLVNKGTGENYGIELTLERFFANSYYFLLNGSVFNSTYRSLEGKTRNTAYNGNYLANVLVGKEFDGIGRNDNQVFTLNAKVFFSGGQRYIPLLRDADGGLSVNPAQNQFWDYNQAYRKTFDKIYQISLSATYKWNKKKTTHELYLNLDNITNNSARLTEYYSPSKPGSVGYIRQFGFFPNLMYRVYFR